MVVSQWARCSLVSSSICSASDCLWISGTCHVSFLSPNPQSQSTEDNSKHWMQPMAYSSATRLLKKEHCCLYAGWLMQVPYQWQVNKWQLVAVLLSSHFLLCKWQHVLFTHAGIATVVGNAFSRVCLCVCLSVCLCCNRKTAWAINQTWYVHTLLQSSLCWLALTHRSKGQGHTLWKPHSRMVASDHGLYSVHLYTTVLPAAVAGVGLHVDTTAYVF